MSGKRALHAENRPAETGLSGEEIVMAMESAAEVGLQLYRTIYQGDGNADVSGGPAGGKGRIQMKDFWIGVVLQEVMDSLEEQEKRLIEMRYFEEKTQNQVAAAPFP